MSRRTKRRMRCPRCSGKKFKALNKKRQIWECLKEGCNVNFIYIPQSGEYKEITNPSKLPEPRMTTPKQKETANLVSKVKDPLEQFAEDLGF